MTRLLLTAEAVVSSRIEGLQIAERRLLTAELLRGYENSRPDVTEAEVLNRIQAMHWALEPQTALGRRCSSRHGPSTKA